MLFIVGLWCVEFVLVLIWRIVWFNVMLFGLSVTCACVVGFGLIIADVYSAACLVVCVDG